MNAMQNLADNAATQMASKLDNEIRQALNDFWGNETWTLDDVYRRCSILSVSNSPVQTLQADGVPILAIGPLETNTRPTDDGWTVTVTQQFKRLTARR